MHHATTSSNGTLMLNGNYVQSIDEDWFRKVDDRTYQNPGRSASFDTLDSVMAKAIPLGELSAWLEEYAALLDSGVTAFDRNIPYNADQLRADAMLRVMNDLYEEDFLFASLVDLDDDGVDELLVGQRGYGEDDYGLHPVTIDTYRWNLASSMLDKFPRTEESALPIIACVRDKATGEKGILFTGEIIGGMWGENYRFSGRDEELTSFGIGSEYTYQGKRIDKTTFDQIIGQYELVKCLYGATGQKENGWWEGEFDTPRILNGVPAVRETLIGILCGEK